MIVKQLFNWILSIFRKKEKSFRLMIVSELPKEPNEHILYLEGNLKENNYWYALLKCPCGCGDIIMLNLMADAKPSWVVAYKNKSPSVFPSIWRTKNCKSHFWLTEGKVVWA